jgi:hypothetical protein
MDGDVFSLLTGGAKFNKKKYSKEYNVLSGKGKHATKQQPQLPTSSCPRTGRARNADIW